jgi:spore germination cell wall hydrolase CwlJ-like protein
MSNAQKYADITFMALTLWREARGETKEVRRGIAAVIMNRAKNPSWWGHNVMEVLFKKWQFSSMTDPNDKQLTKWPQPNDDIWLECLEIAEMAIEGHFVWKLNGANHYYDVSIPPPAWAAEDWFIEQIGKIRFYRLKNG